MNKSYYEDLFDDRKQFCDSLINFVSRITPPEIDLTEEEYPEEINDTRVISINAAWGYGKTTFMKALKEKLIEKNFTVFTFNAWANDYEGDPLESFINELVPQMLKEINYNKDKEDETAETISLLLAAGNELIRKFSKFDVIEYVQRVQSNKKYIKTNLPKKNSLRNFENKSPFSKQKKEFITQLNNYYTNMINLSPKKENKKIIILVDELDRCKPTFAIELLERIKHLFDTGKYLFIFTINSDQLMESVKQIYGNCFDETGYFRRFFDYEFTLPLPTNKNIKKYFENYSIFSKKQNASGLPDYIHSCFYIENISLRTCEKIDKFILLMMNMTDKTFSNEEASYLAFGIYIKFIVPRIFDLIFIKKQIPDQISKSEINEINKSFKFLKCINFDKILGDGETTEIETKEIISAFIKLENVHPDKFQTSYAAYKIEQKNNFIRPFYFQIFESKENTIKKIFTTKNYLDIERLNSILIFGANQLDTSTKN